MFPFRTAGGRNQGGTGDPGLCWRLVWYVYYSCTVLLVYLLLYRNIQDSACWWLDWSTSGSVLKVSNFVIIAIMTTCIDQVTKCLRGSGVHYQRDSHVTVDASATDRWPWITTFWQLGPADGAMRQPAMAVAISHNGSDLSNWTINKVPAYIARQTIVMDWECGCALCLWTTRVCIIPEILW